MSSPAISVLIPVYNVATRIQLCFNSLKEQTLQSAEFIFVDDGSTDGSGKLCDDFARTEPRARVIHFERNKGTLLARKECIEQATGRFCVWLDPDDYYTSPKSLNVMLAEAEKHDVDMLQYNVSVAGGDKNLHEYMVNWLSWKGDPHTRGCTRILNRFFSNQDRISWNVWNKIYKTSLLKKTVPYIPDAYITCAEDVLLIFICALWAETLAYADTEPLLCYVIAGGVSTGKVDIDHYLNHYASEPQITQYAENIAKKCGKASDVKENIKFLYDTLWNTAFWRLKLLPQHDLGKAFQALCEKNDPVHLVKYCAEHVTPNDEKFLDALSAVAQKKNSPSVKTVGIFYNRYFDGGVERVMSLQIPMFLRMGYKVVLLTEEMDTAIEYPLPTGVERCIIARPYDDGRAEDFTEAIKEHHIDAMVYHASSGPACFYDLLLFKLLAIRSIVIRHESATLPLLYPDFGSFFIRSSFFTLADTVLVLNTMEETFYKGIGVNARYVQNPVAVSTDELSAYDHSKQRVLWIGRLDSCQKQYADALEIMKRVIAKRPHVICDIVGPEHSTGSGKAVSAWILNNNLENSVFWHGRQANVEHFYNEATVHLSTSLFEAFPMMYIESKVYGVPLVTYDLPYLELLKDKKGYISVPQGDMDAAAEAVISILDDEVLAERLSREARESIVPFMDTRKLEDEWRQILESVAPENLAGDAHASDMRLLYRTAMTMINHRPVQAVQPDQPAQAFWSPVPAPAFTSHGRHYRLYIGKYYIYKALSKITSGKTRKTFLQKKEKYKDRIRRGSWF